MEWQGILHGHILCSKSNLHTVRLNISKARIVIYVHTYACCYPTLPVVCEMWLCISITSIYVNALLKHFTPYNWDVTFVALGTTHKVRLLYYEKYVRITVFSPYHAHELRWGKAGKSIADFTPVVRSYFEYMKIMIVTVIA